ncbi:MAG TPA: methyltransferase domain-containing protein [Trueperaceae bacterium]
MAQPARLEKLELERMVHGGFALARLPGGRVALVRGGLPGERVEAELRAKSGVLQGQVTAVLAAATQRVPASAHPGLDYSHISYAGQLAIKREVVRDALSRALKREVEVSAVVPAPREWAYRHAVQPAVSATGLGYRQAGSHDVQTLASDPVAHEAINAIWRLWPDLAATKGVREIAFRCNAAGEVLLCLIAAASPKNYLGLAHELVRRGVAGVSHAPYDARGRFRGGFERLAGARAIMDRYGRFELMVTATSFAQPNPAAASLLYRELEDWVGTGSSALDLYAGSGIIALHLAEHFERVTALEVDRSSVARGRRDAERLGIPNLEFVRADAKRAGRLPEAELITVDPPRAGLAKEVRAAITDADARQLLYVSCDVATWARDVADLETRGWQLRRFQPYDFYPQTHHIEMLSLLAR